MIRKISVILLLLLSFIGSANANPQEWYKKANVAYSKASYDTAIVLYSKIINSGEVSAELYYNLGNAYFKKKDISNAILNYERAHQLNANDEDINFNLQLAQTMVVDKINVLPKFFLVNWWNGLQNMFSSDIWAMISIAMFILTLLGLLIYLFTKSILFKKLTFALSGVFLMVSLISFINSAQLKNDAQSQLTAIIMSPSVNIKSSPDEKGTDIFVLHEGTKVWLTDEVGIWMKIKIADGNTGWIKKINIEKI